MTHADSKPVDLSAEEKLQRVFAASWPDQGWVHIRIVSHWIPPTDSVPPEEICLRSDNHICASEGIIASVSEYSDGREVTFNSIPQRRRTDYSRRTHSIFIQTLNDDEIQELQKEYLALPFEVAFKQIWESLDKDLVRVEVTQDGELARYDITVLMSPQDMEKRFADSHCMPPHSMTFWADQSDHIVRFQFRDFNILTGGEMTYGPPGYRDIYDLGIPKSTYVKDSTFIQVDEAYTTLVDQLNNRLQKGFGDYTAMVVHYDHKPDGSVSRDSGYLTLHSVKGDKWLNFSYRMVSYIPSNWPPTKKGVYYAPVYNGVLDEMPQNWPDVYIRELLPNLFLAYPSQFEVGDKENRWFGRFNQETRSLETSHYHSDSYKRHLSQDGLEGQFWPGSIWSGKFNGIQQTLLADSSRPGILGICQSEPAGLRRGVEDNGGFETRAWFNIHKDVVPVEIDYTHMSKSGAIKWRSHIFYEDYQKLPSGLWYPSHWREIRTALSPFTGKVEDSEGKFRLQIDSKLVLADEWFVDPGKRLPKHPGDAPGN